MVKKDPLLSDIIDGSKQNTKSGKVFDEETGADITPLSLLPERKGMVAHNYDGLSQLQSMTLYMEGKGEETKGDGDVLSQNSEEKEVVTTKTKVSKARTATSAASTTGSEVSTSTTPGTTIRHH